MIGFDRVVGVLLHHMACLGHQLVEHPRVGRGPVGGHLGGSLCRVQGLGEEPSGGRQVPLRGGHNVDDLPVLVDRPVQIHPVSGDLQVRLVDEPTVPSGAQAGPGCIDQLRGEPLHPPVSRHVIHRDAAFGE
jgi:hypothetical protein